MGENVGVLFFLRFDKDVFKKRGERKEGEG